MSFAPECDNIYSGNEIKDKDGFITRMDALSALNLIESFEEHMFLLYDSWGHLFADNPRAAALWEKLKKEELFHRELVHKQRLVAEASDELKGVDIKIDIMVMNRTIDTIMAAMKNPPTTLKQALEIAYMLETSAAEHYVISALKETGGEVGAMLDKYIGKFEEHYSTVLEFIRSERLAPISPEHENLVQLRVPYPVAIVVNGRHKVNACNISEGGVFLYTDVKVKVGQKLALTLPMPKGTINVNAVIRNVMEGKGLGLEFTGMSNEDARVLRGYIERVMSGEKGILPSAQTGPICDTPEDPGAEPRQKAGPAAAPEAAAHETSVAIEAEPAPQRAAEPHQDVRDRVIIVNNDVFSDNDIQMFVSALKDAGMDILELKTPAAALQALADDVTDRAVLLAAETDNDDSFPLIKIIKRDPRFSNLPLLVLSTSFDRTFINRVLAHGASFSHRMNLSPEQLVAFLA